MRRLFALVAAVILVDTMFYAAIVPLLPEYSDELGLSKTAAGVLSASYGAGTLLAALPSGWLAARIGVRQSVLLGLGLLSAASLVFAFADDVVLLDSARFAQGIGGACAWTGGLAWLLAAGPAERRGELLGSVLAVAVAGILLGPVIGGGATVIGPEPVFCGVGVLAAGLAAVVFATPGIAPRPVPGARTVAPAILTRPVLAAFWLVALPSTLAGLVDVLAPLRLDELGATGIAVGAVFLIAAAIEATVSPSIGRLSDRRGRIVPIRVGLLLAAIVAVLCSLPETVAVLGARRGGGLPRDEPDLDAGDGAALRQRRAGRPRPRLRHRAGQPRLGRRPGARRVGRRLACRRDLRRLRVRARGLALRAHPRLRCWRGTAPRRW